jgi:hypothetical protein
LVLVKKPMKIFDSADRRDAERTPCSVAIYCRSITVPQSTDYWPATLLNVSAGGLGLAIERRFEKGTLLVVKLPESAEHARPLLLARVVRAAHQPEGHWVLGCTLSARLSPEEIQNLLEASEPSGVALPYDLPAGA